MNKFLIIILFSLFFLSCKENEILPNSNGYLVFGHFYGECFGEQCIEIFRLESNQVLEDILDKYPSYSQFYKGSYKILSKENFNSVKDIWDYFPEDLLLEKDTVLGCPDCRDQGGLYIEYSKGGIHKFWLIDQDKSKVPEKYHYFMDEVNDKIQLLQ